MYYFRSRSLTKVGVREASERVTALTIRLPEHEIFPVMLGRENRSLQLTFAGVESIGG